MRAGNRPGQCGLSTFGLIRAERLRDQDFEYANFEDAIFEDADFRCIGIQMRQRSHSMFRNSNNT
jgi:uncharacterized protein YjbI with pentapeptide repeats